MDGLNCFGPNANDFRLMVGTNVVTSITKTDWDLPATTTTGAHSPPGSTLRWLRSTGVATNPTHIAYAVNRTYTLKDFIWVGLRSFRLQGTISSGNSSRLMEINQAGATYYQIHWRWSSAGKINFGLGVTSGSVTWGSTEYTADADNSLLWECDSAGTVVHRLYVNGSLEIDGVTTYTELDPSTNGVIQFYGPEAGSSPEHYFSGWLHCQSNDSGERPDETTIFVHGYQGTSDGTDGDYRHNGGSPSTAVYTDVDLDGSDQVETANYWQANGADAYSQTVDTTASLTNTGIVGIHRFVNEAELGSKTVNTWSRLRDGSNTQEIAATNITWTAWRGHAFIHRTDPNGGDWSTYDPADFEYGVRSSGSNNDNDRWAGMIFELAEASYSMGGGAEAYGGVPLGSANAMVV